MTFGRTNRIQSLYLKRLVTLWDNPDPVKSCLRSQFLDFSPLFLSSLFNIIFTETPPVFGLKWFFRINLNRKCELHRFSKKKSILVNFVYTKLNSPCWSIQTKHFSLEAEMVWELSFFISYLLPISLKFIQLPNYWISEIMNRITCHLQWTLDELCSVIKWWEAWTLPSFFMDILFSGVISSEVMALIGYRGG